MSVRLAGLILILLTTLTAGMAHGQEDFLAPEKAFRLEVIHGDADDTSRGRAGLSLRWTIAPGYYLYRDQLQVRASPGQSIGAVAPPPGEKKVDPNFGTVEVYHDSVSLEVDPADATAVEVSWQGCAEAGLCYPPQKQTIVLPGATAGLSDAVSSALAPAASDSPLPGSPSSSDSGITRLLSERSLLWTLPLFFVMGIALAFTPCVLPMAPIVSGIVLGNQPTPRRAFFLSLAFVLAMAAVYALLGMAAAMAGAGLQAALQNRWALLGLAAVFVALALSMFGLFELQLPAFMRDRLAGTGPRTGGSVGAAAGMGAVSALLVGPCMTAPLAGTLLYIAQTGNRMEGALLLLALGLGMGVPLLVLGTVGARYLPRPGPWMDRVKAGFGFVMLGTAAWLAERVVPEPVALLLWGGLLLGLAVTLWHATLGAGMPGASQGPRLLIRSTAIIGALWGGAMILGAAAGSTDPLQPLSMPSTLASTGRPQAAQRESPFETISDPAVLLARLDAAKNAGQPVLVDYYADWCTSCKSIEEEVFGDHRVLAALAGVVLLRADVTASDAAQRALMLRHQVMGPPTVMLFDRTGLERRDARLVGEFTARDLLSRLSAEGG